ncbi:MAG: YtxH domain-containing protein [Thermodesulfobacteriota bacterium]|nr:YtxH domain-containing protein [Thermodesulfobacteriota bacterium]
MRRRLTIWILALTLVGAFSLIGCDKKEETGAEKVKQGVSEMAEEGANATEHGAQTVGEKVEGAAEAVKEKVEEATEAVGEKVEEATEAVGEKVEEAVEAVKGENK